jgi:hypothetical protein
LRQDRPTRGLPTRVDHSSAAPCRSIRRRENTGRTRSSHRRGPASPRPLRGCRARYHRVVAPLHKGLTCGLSWGARRAPDITYMVFGPPRQGPHDGHEHHVRKHHKRTDRRSMTPEVAALRAQAIRSSAGGSATRAAPAPGRCRPPSRPRSRR